MGDCVEPPRASKDVYLNASALSSSDSLLVSLSAPPVSSKFLGLLDSGLSHCFADSSFVKKYKIHTKRIRPIRLRLFDGVSRTRISEVATLDVVFPSGEITPFEFYVTQLDSSCSVVLGHNWLTRYNPLIDWVLGSIQFRTPATSASSSPDISVTSANQPDTSGIPEPNIPDISVDNEGPLPSVSFISAAAFVMACKLPGSQQFTLYPDSLDSVKGFRATTETSELDGVPKEYHEYADVFSDTLSEQLPEHRPFDLQINLEA